MIGTTIERFMRELMLAILADVEGKPNLSETERARRIRRRIRLAESRLVARHPSLGHRDALGATSCLVSASGMVTLGWLYAAGLSPAWITILGCAFLASVLHEIEHDLIHFLYFKNRPLVQDAMMLLVWLFRGNVIHGWYRRRIHFHHHRASGSATDVEERLLGLGQPWGFRRLLGTIDGTMAFLLNARALEEQIPGFDRRSLALASLPAYPIFVFVLMSFLVCHVLLALSPGYEQSAWLVAASPGIDVLAVAWVFPNYLRQAALQAVSSNVHYFEDVTSIHEETQVLRPLFLLPLQLFCFNFGTTHSFHHYVVDQPFYVRQLIAPSVLPTMREHGVRFDDVGTFLRANRFRSAG
jgi:fatty acid desaturase